MAHMDGTHFPGETPEYRSARDALLAAEVELTRQIEAVAEHRRRLPLGGVVPEDYAFAEGPTDLDTEGDPRATSLSELFGPHDTLALYSFMYSSDMARACPMCTSLLDGLDGAAPDIIQRLSFAVVAKSPIKRLRSYARSRGWTNLRLLSSAGTSYNRDFLGEDASGEQRSRLNVFVRRDGETRHFYATEKAATGPDQDERHVDLLWPLWNMLDLTPAGRGDWRPG